MDFSTMKRDADLVKKNLVKVDGGRLLTKAPCSIVFPEHYLKNGMGSIGDQISVVGIFAIVMGDSYAVNKTLNQISFTPETTNIITINDVRYMVMGWDVGSVMCATTEVVLNDKLVYQIYDEITAKGKHPAYFSYVDEANLFLTAKKDAGVNLGGDIATLQIPTANRARVKGNRSKYYRETITSQDQLLKDEAVLVPLRSVSDGASNAVAKLNGAYLPEGISSAALTHTTKVEPMEALLRS